MRYLTSFFIGLFLFALATDAVAQRRSRTSTRDREEKKETLPFKDKLSYNIYLGTIGFNSGFSFSTKFDVGIKPFDSFDAFTVGVGGKLQYAFFNDFGTANDESQVNYAGYPFVRFRVSEDIYLKGEYNFFSRDLGPNSDRVNLSFPMIGGGYVQGFDRWKFGFEILLLVDNSEVPGFGGATPSDFYTLIEYNLAFINNL